MVAIERLERPLHIGDFCPPGHPPSQIIGMCSKNSLQFRGYLESGLSGSCWPELRLTRLFWEDEDSRSSHLRISRRMRTRSMTRSMASMTKRASNLPVFVHCRTVASRLFEDPLLLPAILTHQILTGAKNLLGKINTLSITNVRYFLFHVQFCFCSHLIWPEPGLQLMLTSKAATVVHPFHPVLSDKHNF